MWEEQLGTDLGIDIHLSCAQQQADHFQVPNFGCMMETGRAVLLLRETQASESFSWHPQPPALGAIPPTAPAPPPARCCTLL